MNTIDFLGTREILDYLKTQPVKKAFLFGSYARQEESPESDVDILLDLDHSVNLFQFISIKLSLEKLLNKSVDLLSTNGLSPRIKPFIDNNKILIYERKDQ